MEIRETELQVHQKTHDDRCDCVFSLVLRAKEISRKFERRVGREKGESRVEETGQENTQIESGENSVE